MSKSFPLRGLCTQFPPPGTTFLSWSSCLDLYLPSFHLNIWSLRGVLAHPCRDSVSHTVWKPPHAVIPVHPSQKPTGRKALLPIFSFPPSLFLFFPGQGLIGLNCLGIPYVVNMTLNFRSSCLLIQVLRWQKYKAHSVILGTEPRTVYLPGKPSAIRAISTAPKYFDLFHYSFFCLDSLGTVVLWRKQELYSCFQLHIPCGTWEWTLAMTVVASVHAQHRHIKTRGQPQMSPFKNNGEECIN